MKLAFIAPEFLPTWGGQGTYSVELLRNLCQMGINVHLITPKRGQNYDVDKISSYFNDRITIHNISTAKDFFFYNIKFQLGLVQHFYFLHRKHQFDIVHISNLVNMPDFFLKFIGLNIPSVTTVHSTLKGQSHVKGATQLSINNKVTIERLTSLFYPVLQCCEWAYLKKSTNLITVSKWVKSILPRNISSNIRVIHNGIDTERFSPERRNSNEFSFLGEITKPKVLYAGRLLALKGVDTLLKSIKYVLKKCDVCFLIVGTGDIEKWKSSLCGIPEKNYKFLGYVDYEIINCLYAKVDLFVLPSFTESFPLVILEAMASGVPVIATNVGGIPEIIENHKDGILIEPNNPEILADNIITLLQNPTQRKTISKNAREKVVKNFTSKVMAEKTKKYYEEILLGRI